MQTFTVERDPERPGIWITCTQMHEGKPYSLRTIILDKPDHVEHARMVLKAQERLARAVERTVENAKLARIGVWDGVELWKAESPHAPADAAVIALPEKALEEWDRVLHAAKAENRPIKVAKLDERSYVNLRADLIQNAVLFGSKWEGPAAAL